MSIISPLVQDKVKQSRFIQVNYLTFGSR